MSRKHGYTTETEFEGGKHIVNGFFVLSGEERLIIVLIFCVLFICFVLLLLAVVRRVRNKNRYRKLDYLRAYYLPRLHITATGEVSDDVSDFIARSGSLKWIAIGECLSQIKEKRVDLVAVTQLFQKLGYTAYYEKELERRNNIRKAAAIDKLGRMSNEDSASKILPIFVTGNTEIIAVAARSICRMGGFTTIRSMLDVMPELLTQSRISRKTILTSLLCGGPAISALILDYGMECRDPRLLSLLLEVLQSYAITKEVSDFAAGHLSHTDPEVRSKALNVLACHNEDFSPDINVLTPLLKDPVWFVRLQAVRALGLRQCNAAAGDIGALVLDEKWQVRNAAALALTRLGDVAVDIFLAILQSSDRYAKESICEEIEKSDFVQLLLDKLKSHDTASEAKACEILGIMVSLNFSSPLREVIKQSDDYQLVHKVRALLIEAATS